MKSPKPEDRANHHGGCHPDPHRPNAGMRFWAARSLDEVLEAWRLVYTSYRRKNLISANRHRIHTAPQAVSSNASVILGGIGPVIATTLTGVLDSDAGLPLDRVYKPQLDTLRGEGRKLMEVTLFADRRKELARTADALFDLMRFAWYFGLANKVTDFLIGVHPRHARFYIRGHGFEPAGPEATYPAVNHQPVVLLRYDEHAEQQSRARRYFTENPCPPEAFVGRFDFAPHRLVGTPIESFLADYARTVPLAARQVG